MLPQTGSTPPSSRDLVGRYLPPVAHQAKRSFMNFFAVALAFAAAPVGSRSCCARSPNFPAASRRRWSVGERIDALSAV